MPRRRNDTNNLDFIANATLRRKIEHAIEITSALYLKRNEKGVSKGIALEFCRMEILYAASIIEAILLYMFKSKNEKLNKLEYKEVYPLPSSYQSSGSPILVLAKQSQIPRQERELMLDNLLVFFTKNGTIKNDLKKKIDKARTVRNTFHLAKSRQGIRCDALSVNSAYDAVIDIFSVARAHLKAKKN